MQQKVGRDHSRHCKISAANQEKRTFQEWANVVNDPERTIRGATVTAGAILPR